MALEVVERFHRDKREIRVPSPADEEWLTHIAADLEFPSAEFRQFLWRFGQESKKGALDMKALTLIHRRLSVPAPPAGVVEETVRFFPDSSEMTALKRCLLGPAGPGDLWGLPEDQRLLLALRAGSSADADDLQIASRLRRLAIEAPAEAAEVAAVADGEEAESLVLEAFLQAATPELVAHLLLHSGSTASELITAAPQVLEDPGVWAAAERNECDLFDLISLDNLIEDSVIRALIVSRSTRTIAQLCRLSPEFAIGAVVATGDLIDENEWTWRQADPVLEAIRVQSNSLIHALRDLKGAALCIALSILAPRVAARHLETGRLINLSGEPNFLRPRIATVRVLKALNIKNNSNAKQLWQKGFPVLHRALLGQAPDAELWEALDSVLPDRGSWDRCHRLRKALAGHIRRSSWSVEEVESLVAVAGKEADRLFDLLSTKKKPWYASVAERFIP